LNVQDIVSDLTGPGAEFEMELRETGGVELRMFRNGPKTLPELYRDSAARYADREFLVFGEERYTFGEFFARAETLRRRLNLEPGTRVAIAMRNRPEWLLAYVAVTAAGASAVLANSRGTPAELAFAIEDTDSSLVIADTPRAAALREAGSRVPIIVIDNDPSLIEPADGPLLSREVDPECEATIIFTTGTSGVAKGAMLSHRNLMASLMNINFSRTVATYSALQGMDPAILEAMQQIQPSVLTAFPLFHVAGLNSDFLSFLMLGGKLVLMSKWNATEALALIERERIVSTSGSPAMVWDLVRAHDNTRDLSSLRGLGIGGQAVPPTLLADIRRVFPNSSFGCGFGQTETSGPVSATGLRDLLARPGNSGRPVPTLDIRIAAEDGTDLPVGEVGEIIIRGPSVAMGYCNRPAENTETFQDGWVRTGDIGYLDTDKFLYVVDRKKSIIISGGENISLSEVEFAALAVPSVIDAAAIGIPDERMGEILALAIVVENAPDFEVDTIREALASILAAYKLPGRIVTVDAIPRNHMGKIDRKALARSFE
jgi:long-chain acyl-CoA synthetase